MAKRKLTIFFISVFILFSNLSFANPNIDQWLESEKSYKDLITFVKDRPGHDKRYAIDSSKIQRDLGWKPKETFESGIRKTIHWYLENQTWYEKILSGNYRFERLGK